MASAESQRKWRDKNRFVKKQLNVMARTLVHDYLDDIARDFALRGKGEAVTFACFVTKALMQRAEYNAEVTELLDVFRKTYGEDRDVYSA